MDFIFHADCQQPYSLFPDGYKLLAAWQLGSLAACGLHKSEMAVLKHHSNPIVLTPFVSSKLGSGLFLFQHR